MIDWRKASEQPQPGRSYLVRTIAAGPVYDVAFFNGKRRDGSSWWTLTDVEVEAKAITHWAEINEPASATADTPSDVSEGANNV